MELGPKKLKIENFNCERDLRPEAEGETIKKKGSVPQSNDWVFWITGDRDRNVRGGEIGRAHV